MKYSLSIVLPAYNEAENIDRSVKTLIDVSRSICDKFEIIVVNDGSTDRTSSILNSIDSKNLVIVNHKNNLGYGEALKSGIRSTMYDYIFITDSDLQFDANELCEFIKFIPEYDAVVGYRYKRNDPIIRLINAWIWNKINKLLFGLNYKDIDCAFKLFKASKLKNIKLISSGAMISPELMFNMKSQGCKIKELPVKHFARIHGNPTGAKFHVIFRAGKEVVGFYLNKIIFKK